MRTPYAFSTVCFPPVNRMASILRGDTEQQTGKPRLRCRNGLRILAALKMKETDGTPTEVLPNLYIGSIGAAVNNERLQELGITNVLSLCGDIGFKKVEKISYKYFNVSDKPKNMHELFSILNDCILYIDEVLSERRCERNHEGRCTNRILVHCMMGKSRSATVIIAYLMTKHSMKWREALEFLRGKRPIIEPNIGFILGLRKLERGSTQ